MTENRAEDAERDHQKGRCRADGPVTRKRVDGPVMSRRVCDLPAGHDGPHKSGHIEWGDSDE